MPNTSKATSIAAADATTARMRQTTDRLMGSRAHRKPRTAMCLTAPIPLYKHCGPINRSSGSIYLVDLSRPDVGHHRLRQHSTSVPAVTRPWTTATQWDPRSDGRLRSRRVCNPLPSDNLSTKPGQPQICVFAVARHSSIRHHGLRTRQLHV